MANSVFVLGGGRMGVVAVRDLVNSDIIDEVIIGDIDPARAQTLQESLGSSKVRAVGVDAKRQPELTKAIRGCKALINATWYEHNLDVMRAAIQEKVHYNDLGGLFHMTRKQMELNSEAEKSGITAVLGGGESPGITNVMVALSAQKLDIVRKIRIRVGGKEFGTDNRLVFPFAVSTVFDEYSKTPVMYLDGLFKEVAPLSGDEVVYFPDPVGENTCHYSIHSEIATLPLSFKQVTHVDFKLGLSQKIFTAIKPLIDAGLDTTCPVDIKGTKISPHDFAIAYLQSRSSNEEPERYVVVRTETEGERGGKSQMVTCEAVGKPESSLGVRNATALMTGVGASVITQMILSGQIIKRGVVAPEICVPPTEFLEELKKRNISVSVKD